MSMRRHLAWMSLSQGCFFLIQFLSSVFVARLLSPYEMGVYAVAMAIVGVLSTIQSFGLSGFIVRERDMSKDLMASTFTINAAISLTLGLLVAGLSTVGGAFLHEKGVRNVMLVLSLSPILGIFEFLPATNLERSAQFKVIAMMNTGRTIIAQGLTVLLAFKGFSYMSMAYGQIAAAVFSAIAYMIVGRQHVSLRLHLAEWRRVTSFGLNMLAISGVNSIAARTAEFLLGRLVGLSALGLYSRASNLNNLAWENIHLVIGRVVFVDLAAQKRNGESLRASYLKIVEIITALLWPLFAGLAIVAGPFILAVYGPKWVAAAHPLVMLALSAMVLVAITMTWEIFVVCQETSRQAKIEFVRTGAGLAMFAVGCLISLTGAAAARVGEAVFSVILYRPHLNRMTDTQTGDFTGIYLRSAMLTVVAVAPAAILMWIYHASERTPLAYVLGAVALGVTLWLVLLLLYKHPLAQELTRLLKSRG